MSDLTPIRIRGKRKAIAAEKWHHGKRRKVTSTESSASLEKDFSAQTESNATTKRSGKQRKPRQRQLSRLESLPTEVVQLIFELSENLELPSTSPVLASQLSSPHLYAQMTVRLLEPISRCREHDTWPQPVIPRVDCKTDGLTAATRLMSSKFFTYPFIKDWLRKEYDRLELADSYRMCGYHHAGSEHPTIWTWLHLGPCLRLLPPRKLFFAPFTDDKVHFLELITSQGLPRTLVGHYPQLDELASEGLQQAVADKSVNTLSAFWHMGLQPNTELLQQAVTKHDCDRSVVYSVTWHALMHCPAANMDWLDPELWSWAERADARGDSRGRWLKEILKTCAKHVVPDTKEEDKHLFRGYMMERCEEPFSEYVPQWERDSWHGSQYSE